MKVLARLEAISTAKEPPAGLDDDGQDYEPSAENNLNLTGLGIFRGPAEIDYTVSQMRRADKSITTVGCLHGQRRALQVTQSVNQWSG